MKKLQLKKLIRLSARKVLGLRNILFLLDITKQNANLAIKNALKVYLDKNFLNNEKRIQLLWNLFYYNTLLSVDGLYLIKIKYNLFKQNLRNIVDLIDKH